MFEKWTEDDLYRAAKHVADAIIEDALAGLLPVDAETWSDFHAYVDANEYATTAVEELRVTIPEGQDEHGMSWAYLFMSDAEDVAWAIFKVTPRLVDLRALVKRGAEVRYVSEHDNEDYGTFKVVSQRCYRASRSQRTLVVDLENPRDPEDLVQAEVTDLRAV